MTYQVTHKVRRHLLCRWIHSTEGQAVWLVLEVAHRDLRLCIRTILEGVYGITADDTLWQTIPPLYNFMWEEESVYIQMTMTLSQYLQNAAAWFDYCKQLGEQEA